MSLSWVYEMLPFPWKQSCYFPLLPPSFSFFLNIIHKILPSYKGIYERSSYIKSAPTILLKSTRSKRSPLYKFCLLIQKKFQNSQQKIFNSLEGLFNSSRHPQFSPSQHSINFSFMAGKQRTNVNVAWCSELILCTILWIELILLILRMHGSRS